MIEEILQKQAEFHATTNGGVLPDPVDSRDYDAEKLMGSNLDVAVDWIKGYSALTPWMDMPNQNQENQFSCVARAWSAYKQILQAKDTGEHTLLSARSIYNPIAFPGQGSYVRDGGLRTVNYGVNKEETVPSGGTESEITAKFDFSPFAVEAAFYKNSTIASVSTQNFDTLAKMILLNNGLVSGWASHCQYFKEFGTLQGRRFLKTHGSYGPNSDMYYFEGTGDQLFSSWTAIDLKNIQNPPSKNLLSVNLNFGDSGSEVVKFRQALNSLGWTNNIHSTVYNQELADVFYNFQKGNIKDTFNFGAIWEALKGYQGRYLGSALRSVINNLLK